MTSIEAIVLGIVQGLTEFLPISSTAHLRVLPSLLGWGDPGAAVSAVIQLGTMIAVVAFFRRDLLNLLSAFVKGLRSMKPFEQFESRLAWYIGIGTVPVGIFGLLFKHLIETSARSLYVIAASLILFALILALAEKLAEHRREIRSVTLWDSFLIGIAQAFALIPGASRSGTTITAALFLGMNREAAARFSFLLSVPAVVASGCFEFYQIRNELSGAGTLNLVLAVVVSATVGYAAIAFLLRYLRTHSTFVFIFYRILLGGFILFLLSRNVLSAL
jgi:undecaprenyl-diphosphatase